MVEDRITDGRRIAQLLSSEVDGREDDELAWLAVTDVDQDVEPTAEGARAYDVSVVVDKDEEHDTSDRQRLARVFIHDEYARLEFEPDLESVVTVASDLELRSQGPTVFVESGAEVKRATRVVRAGARTVLEDGDE